MHKLNDIKSFLGRNHIKIIAFISIVVSALATGYFLKNGSIVSYGDSESHLNIAKRVISSPTPGLAQLGGVWLPLPHLLMIPFVFFDPVWRTGLAGSIVSGLFFVFSSIYLYKLIFFVTRNKIAGFFGFAVFAVNTNILYMQSTPMTEMPLIGFFIASSYYFVRFLYQMEDDISLILAAFFGFLATLTRYDGWFLVAIEGAIVFLLFVFKRFNKEFQGKVILFSTLAFVGILLWMVWDLLILGDAFYFTNSPFSAKSQQQGWMLKGELPTYKNIIESIIYYSSAVLQNVGEVFLIGAGLGLIIFLFREKIKNNFFVLLILFTPFIFYVVTLYLGQSVIFIPSVVPKSFEWNLFNSRYGIMMVPAAAFFVGYLFSLKFKSVKFFVLLLIVGNCILFFSGKKQTITYVDGKTGLSSSRPVDAEKFLTKNYDGGYILIDDYARSVSIIRSKLPMQKVIYIGSKPYWEESLKEPEKYAKWIVLQKNDALWNGIYENPVENGRLYKYFKKVYTSNNILIFERSG